MIVDTVADRGPVQGLIDVMSDTGGCVLVTPVDLPDLTAAMLQPMVRLWQQDRGRIVVANGPGGIEPLVAIYPHGWLGELVELAQSPDRSLRRWIAGRPHQLFCVDPVGLRNVNRRGD